MKKIFLFFLLISFYLRADSQSIYDIFDNSSCSGNSSYCSFADNLNSTLGNDCLPYWNASHGTPNLFNSNNYIAPGAFANFVDLKSKLNGKTCLNMFYLGNGIPYLDACQYGSEGAFREFKFTKDKCYRIVFNVSISGNKKANDKYYLRMWAARNLPIAPKNGNSVDIIPTVSNSDKESISNYDFSNVAFNYSTFTSFQQVEIFYRPSSDNFNEFWIYPDQDYTPGDVAQSIYAITDFRIEESCAQSINLNSPNLFYSGNFNASESISVGSVSPLVNFSLVQSTEFTAGNYIEFLPNTELKKTSVNQYISAYIQPCTVLSSSCYNSNTFAGNQSIENINSLKIGSYFSEKNVLISPNPTFGILNLSLEGKIDEEVEIEIYNLTGNRVFTEKGIKNNFLMDISNNPNGFYIIHVKYKDSMISYKVNKL